MITESHRHLIRSQLRTVRQTRAREKAGNRRPLVECPHCGKYVRGLEQHVGAKHPGADA